MFEIFIKMFKKDEEEEEEKMGSGAAAIANRIVTSSYLTLDQRLIPIRTPVLTRCLSPTVLPVLLWPHLLRPLRTPSQMAPQRCP
jgi:hypothetical protein